MYAVQKYKLSYVREPDHAATRERRLIAHRTDAAEFCKKYLNDVPLEHACILALDARNKVIGFMDDQVGTGNQCVVYVSNVFRFLLSTSAVAFVVAHNHPGGGERPSESDWLLTERLYKAGQIMEVSLIDHIIIAEENVVSLRDSPRWPKGF